MHTDSFLTSFSTFALFHLDHEGHTIDGNEAAKKLLHLKNNEPIPKDVFIKFFSSQKTNGEQWFKLNNQAPLYAYFELSKMPDGKGYLLILKETTTKQSHLETDEKLFNLSVDLLCLAGMDGCFKRLNPAFTEALGYTEEELCSKPFTEFIHPDDVNKTIDEIIRLQNGEEVWLFENRYRAKNGEYKWLSWKSIPDGDMIYGAARDVTELKEVEALYKKLSDQSESQQKQIESILMNAPITLWAIDNNGIFQFYEGRGLKSLPPDKDKAIGRNVFNITNKFPKFGQAIKDALTGQTVEQTNDFAGTRFSTRFSPQFDDNGNVTGVIAVTFEIGLRN